jgi:hypothetical protein
MPGSPQWSLSFRFPNRNPVHPSPLHHTCYMPPPQLISLYFITRTILGEQYRSWSSSLWSFLHSPVISPLLGSNTPLNTLFSNTPAYVPPLMSVNKFQCPKPSFTPILNNSVSYSLYLCLENWKKRYNRFCTEWQQALLDVINTI